MKWWPVCPFLPSSILRISSRSQIFALFFSLSLSVSRFASAKWEIESNKYDLIMADVNSMEYIEVLLTQMYTLTHTLSHTFFRLNATLLVPVCSFIFNAATSVCNIFCLCLFFNVVQGACQHAVFLLGWQRIRCIHSLFLKLLFT